MSQFTKQDEIETGIPLDLLRKWETIMDNLWGYFQAYAKKEKQVKITDKKNQIQFQLGKGPKFQIKVDFINESYLSLAITADGVKDFEARIDKIENFSHEGIIRTVAVIITYSADIK